MNTTNQTYHSKVKQESEQLNIELRLLSINKARKIMGIRYVTLKKLIYEGKIEVIEIEGNIKIPHINLLKYIQLQSKFMNNISETVIDESEIRKSIQKIIKKNS